MKKWKHSLLLAGCLLTCAGTAASGDSSAVEGVTSAVVSNYTLEDFIQIGLERNFAVQIARNEQQIAQNEASVLNSDFIPSLSLNASHAADWQSIDQTTHEDVTTHTDAYYSGVSAIGLYLNWTLFDGLNNVANFQRFKAQLQLQDVKTMIAIEDFMLSMSQEYYTYILLKQRLSIQEQVMELSKERLRVAQINYQSGRKSNVEWLQARVDYNNDSTSLIETKQTIDLQRITINHLMMADHLQNRDWEINVLDISCDSILLHDDLWNDCLLKNTSLLLAQKQTDLSIIDLKSYRSAFFPTIKLSGGYAYQINRAHAGSYAQRNVADPNIGVSLSLPIFRTQDIQRQKNAQLTQINRELAQKDVKQQLNVEFENHWLKYLNYIHLVDLEKINLKSAQASLDAATLQYQQSQISGLELREAQNSYLQNQYVLLELHYNAKLEEVYLCYLAGRH